MLPTVDFPESRTERTEDAPPATTGETAGYDEELVSRLSAFVDACVMSEPEMDPWLSEAELELRLGAI